METRVTSRRCTMSMRKQIEFNIQRGSSPPLERIFAVVSPSKFYLVASTETVRLKRIMEFK